METDYFESRLRVGWEARLAFARTFCRPADRVLDLGCHVGEYTLPIATLVQSVEAVDRDPEPLAFLTRHNSSVTTTCGDLRSWKPSTSYDGIVCLNTFMLLPPEAQQRMVRWIPEHLNPGGWAMIDFHDPGYNLFRAIYQRPIAPRRLRALAKGIIWRGTTRRKFEAMAPGWTYQRSPELLAAREVEGHRFDTLVGEYWRLYRFEAPARPLPTL
jgi:2-polyprenyl-3-methyl-5-hydroxy-6-metoxy-1,4-benzoquinol methylase